MADGEGPRGKPKGKGAKKSALAAAGLDSSSEEDELDMAEGNPDESEEEYADGGSGRCARLQDRYAFLI